MQSSGYFCLQSTNTTLSCCQGSKRGLEYLSAFYTQHSLKYKSTCCRMKTKSRGFFLCPASLFPVFPCCFQTLISPWAEEEQWIQSRVWSHWGSPGWHTVNGVGRLAHTPETSDNMGWASSSSLCDFRDDSRPWGCSKILFFKIHAGSVSAYIFSSNSPVIHKCSFCSSEAELLTAFVLTYDEAIFCLSLKKIQCYSLPTQCTPRWTGVLPARCLNPCQRKKWPPVVARGSEHSSLPCLEQWFKPLTSWVTSNPTLKSVRAQERERCFPQSQAEVPIAKLTQEADLMVRAVACTELLWAGLLSAAEESHWELIQKCLPGLHTWQQLRCREGTSATHIIKL